MLSSVSAQSTDLARRFRRAVDGGRLEEANALLPQLPSPAPVDLCLHIGRLHASQRQWPEAAAALSRLPKLDGFGQMLLNLSRNLTDLKQHRPAVYEIMMATPDDGRYTIGSGVGGLPVIVAKLPDGQLMSLSPGNDPKANVRRTMAANTGYAAGAVMALLGLGDGHLLTALAHHPPALFMDQQVAVHFLEQDPQLVMICLMAHDYSGDDGPIRQKRIQWYIGPDCAQQYGNALLADAMLPSATVIISQSEAASHLANQLRAAHDRLDAEMQATRQRVHARYQNVEPAHTVAALTQQLGRRPRMLLFTSRLTTVLQYSTRDAAAAARQAGWDTQTFIETERYHTWTKLAVLRAIEAFEPDALFQIDHLRYEIADLFPPKLPFICWIQDHLPNLTNAAAGQQAAADPMAFILAEYPFGYVDRFGYPADRCMALPKLTRPLQRPDSWKQDGDDIVYVSNASDSPAELIQRLLAPYEAGSIPHQLFNESARRIVAVYANGGSLSNRYEVQAIADAVAKDMGLALPRSSREQVGLALSHPLNNALYRQQTLDWAASIARERGLRMSLYGKGWESHPTLSQYARGPVAYGPALEDLTRRSRMNLQVVPFSCMHQRLLDGLSAGGFFLVRLSTTDILMRRLHALLSAARLPEAIRTREAALNAFEPAGRAILEAVLLEGGPLATSDLIDPVELVRSAEAAGLLVPGSGDLIPHLDRTGFQTRDELARAIDLHLNDEPMRRKIADEQWNHLADRVTYDAGMARMTRWLIDRLEAVAGPMDRAAAA